MFNPALLFLIFLGGFILWLVLSFAFRMIGRIIDAINRHTRNALDLDEPVEDEGNTYEENGGNEK